MSLLRFRQNLTMGMSPMDADLHASLWKGSAPPDYKPMADATKYSVDMMKEMSDAQLAESIRQFDLMEPTMSRIANSQADAMDQQFKQGKEQYDFYKDNYRPVEEGLIEDVNNYNTVGERERIASTAAADVAKAETQSRKSNARSMASMGINPNSMKYASINKKSGLQTATIKAGAMTGARNRAKDIGYARKLDITGLGRGLPGASTAAYSSGVSSGNSASSNTMAPSNFLMRGYQGAANTLGGAANANISGNQAILNSQSSYANSQSNQMGIGDYIATAGAAWAGTGFAT